MLDDISAVKTWDKVNSGMIKMYSAEVLGKLPVAQHMLFGSLLPYEGPVSNDVQQQHSHGQGWGDCCGIAVPSAFAAAGGGLRGAGIRAVPFD